jgi:hypothetical protein
LQIGLFFRQNGPLYWAYLEANAAVDAGGKVNPVPVGALGVFAWSFMNTSDWTGIDAVGYPFTNVSHNGVGHNLSLQAQNNRHKTICETWRFPV